jgi:PiT family inorganic phosphate transporter
MTRTISARPVIDVPPVIEETLEAGERAALKTRIKQQQDPAHFSKPERKTLKKVYRRELVKRSQLLRIAAAWVITVPASALMAALAFFILRHTMGG